MSTNATRRLVSAQRSPTFEAGTHEEQYRLRQPGCWASFVSPTYKNDELVGWRRAQRSPTLEAGTHEEQYRLRRPGCWASFVSPTCKNDELVGWCRAQRSPTFGAGTHEDGRTSQHDRMHAYKKSNTNAEANTMEYRRAQTSGATYFFTVNLADRQADTLVRHIDDLRFVMRAVKLRHAFALLAMVVLPEHLHAIWRLPTGDANYPLRWSLIKSGFSRRLAKRESIHGARRAKRERGIWQRRYWEHQIRSDIDLSRHVDYIHNNPVKHGWVLRAVDWPYSTLQAYVARGMASEDLGGNAQEGPGDRCGER
jgi:putative transposase